MLAPREKAPAQSDPSVEGHVSWFIGESTLIILLSFLLGLLVGWALWRRPWHKRYFTESEAITRVSREHSQSVAEHGRALAAKDAEISRLQALLDDRDVAGAAVAAPLVAADAAAAVDDPATSADAADGSADETVVAEVEPAAEPVVVESAESIDIAEVETPQVDVADHAGPAVDVHEVSTPAVDVADDATASAQVSGPGAAAPVAEDPSPAAADVVTDSITITPADLTETPAESTESTPEDAAQDAAAAPAEATAEAPAEDAGPQVSAIAPLVGDASGAGEDGNAPVEDEDLERVEGIGPRIAAALRAAGITTFRRLADSDVASLQAALEAAGLRFAPSLPTWSRQARLLADGDEDGFLQLTEQLVGGRDIGRRA